MPPGLSHILAFVIGGIVFRYFEEIRDFVLKVREDLTRARESHQNNLKRY